MNRAIDPTPPVPGDHSSAGMGAAYAVAAQVDNVDAINKLIKTTALLVAALAKNVEAVITQMDATLNADQTAQNNFYQEFGGAKPTDVLAWMSKYDQANLAPGELQCPDDIMSAMIFWTQNNGTIGDSMTAFQDTFNADQLMGQANLAAAQRPLNLWNQTVSDQNKSTATDYKLCQALLSIMRNLSVQVNR